MIIRNSDFWHVFFDKEHAFTQLLISLGAGISYVQGMRPEVLIMLTLSIIAGLVNILRAYHQLRKAKFEADDAKNKANETGKN